MRYQLIIGLPRNAELALYLIKQELKSNKFFSTLARMGGGDFHYRPNLDSLILSYSGFKDISDDLLEFYVKKLDQYSRKIDPDDRSITKYAFKLYLDLQVEKRKKSDKDI